MTLRLSRPALAALLLVSACSTPAPPANPADLVLLHGRVVTLDSANPVAQAIAIKGDRLMAVGSDSAIEAMVGPRTNQVDLKGQLAIPGLIEGHGHFMGLGRSRLQLNLTRAKKWDDIVSMVGASTRDIADGAWVMGRGWHQEKWDGPPAGAVEGMPVHASLDSISPKNPVFLVHASGHAAMVNGLALKLAGIDRHTPNPPGGEILKGPDGEPTGVLRETAQGLVRKALGEWQAQRTPEEQEAEALKAVELAGEDVLSKGITSFQDAGSSFATIDFFRRLAKQGKLPVRLYVMVGGESTDSLKARLRDYRMLGFGRGFLTVRAIKLVADGALGSRGAWLLQPYEDLKTSTGLATTPPKVLEERARIALADSFQVATHAIGDRANREVLDVYERVMGGRTDLRWRVEHAQHLDPADQPRFARLGVIASMQGIHATSDGPWVLKRLGAARAEAGAYVWHTLLASGAVVTNGTDVPVEDADPIASFDATVRRKLPDGSEFYPAQKMTRDEALRAYTASNAWAAFEEQEKGRLVPGMLADVTVLSRDIMTVPEDSIVGTKAVYTIVGGKIAYQAKAP
ncbi:MAG: amidohydrolase [Gemmatimonadales bacterium]